ncbi:MAG: hypothetical protein AAGF82_07660 [Pseudomonadota bacterium]
MAGFAGARVPELELAPELEAADEDVFPGPDAVARDPLVDAGDGLEAPVCPEAPAPEVFAADADPAAAAALLPLVADAELAAPGFAPAARGLSCFFSAGFLSAEAVLPVLGIPVEGEDDAEEDGAPVPALPGFSSTFSALRSIVTGRFVAAPEPVDGFSVLPGLSAEPDPLPPGEDAPPEDLLSVAICSPPEPFDHTIHT